MTINSLSEHILCKYSSVRLFEGFLLTIEIEIIKSAFLCQKWQPFKFSILNFLNFLMFGLNIIEEELTINRI